jgi:hypothetical protein
MSEIYETVLHRFSEKIKPTQDIHFFEGSDKVALIVDPRYDASMEAAIRQHMFFLNPRGWNLMVVSHNFHKDQIRADFPNCIFAEIDESLVYYNDSKPNITIDGYNRIFLSPHFWSALPVENIFVFQKDCFMYKMFDDKFLEYDFVGARSVFFVGENNIQSLVTNGGFSLRKKTAMLECLRHVSFTQLYKDLYQTISKQKINIINPDKLGKRNEDIFFSLACELLCKNIPEHHIQPEFAVEAEYNIDTAGHHGWNKSYHTVEQVLEILSINSNYKDLLETNIKI